MSSDDDWENFDVSAARRDSDSEEEFIESESEPEDTNVPKVVKPKKPKLIVVDRYDKIQYENIDEISKLAEQCAEKFEEAKKAQPALSALAAKMMHEMLKQFQDRLTLNTLESCKGNFERILKAKTLAKNQKMQAKADLSKHTTARKDAKFNKDDALAEVYGGEGDWDEDWDEEGWDDKGWYDDDGNWVEGEASDDKKEEEKKQQPAASSSSGPAADAFPALGGAAEAFPSLGGDDAFPAMGGAKPAGGEAKGVWGK